MTTLGSRSLFMVILEGSSLITLNILCFIGNVLVCLAVHRNPRLRISTNLYVIALAISDLISAVFVMPISGVILFKGKWPFGESLCEFHAFISLFIIYVSPATMSLTAINRYFRICKSNASYRKIFSQNKSCVWLAMIWLFVAGYIAIPRLTELQGFEFVPGYAQCSIKHINEKAKIIHYLIVVTFFLIIPSLATAVSYTKVFKTIRQHNVKVLPSICQIRRGVNETRISVQEIKLSRSLFIVVLAFMLCWVPFWLIVIIRRFFVIQMPRNIELMCMFCLYVSNTINPVIYAGMNSSFRSEFRRIITCRSRRLVSSQSMQGGKGNSVPVVLENNATNIRTARIKPVEQIKTIKTLEFVETNSTKIGPSSKRNRREDRHIFTVTD